MSRTGYLTLGPYFQSFGPILLFAVACGSSETEAPESAASTGSTPVPAAVDAKDTPARQVGAKYGGNIKMSAYADTRDWDPKRVCFPFQHPSLFAAV
ncbi:MAG: hypothetical protein Ct9H300mP11_09670 [Chloroflexota bacterium]|nr:MAG: hypothetical protein Ct9H300mP11_09670 [Chloroflexota bacterium]